MNLKDLFSKIKEFSKETHGSSSYDKDELFVMGEQADEFVPLKFLCKKTDSIRDIDDLLMDGFLYDSYELFNFPDYQKWYERQFGKKLTRVQSRKISILHLPDNKSIFDAISTINKGYDVLKCAKILLNSKNLPVQLGEWYAKCVFGLNQVKSTSQRGFDFQLNGKRVEIKVHWGDHSSPKGVKVKKSMVELSNYVITMYLANNFMIREICFLDSSFVIRKFAGKGHTIFLKDIDINSYFFSKSNKHADKVKNSSALLKYSSPTLAMKLAEYFSNEVS